MEYRLDEIFELQMGKTPSRNCMEYWNQDKENKWISISDLTKSGKYIKETKEYISDKAVLDSGISLIPKDTVIMSFKLSIGKVAITSDNMYSNEAIMAFHDKKKIELLPDYVYYLLRAKKWTDGLNSAVLGMTLNKATLSKCTIDVHDEEIQKHIVEVLDSASQVIEFRRKQLQLLDSLVNARFVEMFGEDTRKKEEFSLKKLGECCIINPKKNEEVKLEPKMLVSFIPMSAVSEDGKISTLEIKNYEEVRTGFTFFAEDDVLFAKITPCMENGKGAIAKKLWNGIGFGSTEFHVLRPKENISNSYWLLTLTKMKNFRLKAEMNMTGSAGQKRVPISFLDSYQVSLPPIELQNQFADFVNQVDKSKLAVQKSLEEAQLLFDSLMQEYFG